jgi:hypothetical protein
VPERADKPIGAVEVAQQLAAELDDAGCEYALGGAIALGIWAEPRGTLDVDVTLFLTPDQPTACVRLLQKIGCSVRAAEALQNTVSVRLSLAGDGSTCFSPPFPSMIKPGCGANNSCWATKRCKSGTRRHCASSR